LRYQIQSFMVPVVDMTVSTARPSTGDWWRSAVIYQVYIRSFADGSGDGIGDIAGIRSRLNYLKRLGIDAIWITPWYRSPLADGGYDVADYRSIHSNFGTLNEAEALIADALEMGIRTLIDVVPNHVSDQHPWFRDAMASSPESAERSRFWFHPGKGDGGDEIPTHWVSSFAGETWTRTRGGNGLPDEWYLHLFAPQQPDLNWSNPDVRAEHEDILRFWFNRGVAGVRIDSATLLIKDPKLPEVQAGASAGTHPFIDRDEIHDIYRSWRHVADSFQPPRVLVGEVWLDDPERFAAYLRPDEIHTAFNFAFMAQPWDAEGLRASITATLTTHGLVGAPATWVLSNHDVTRPVTRYGREDSSFDFSSKRFGVPTDLVRGRRRARAAALLAAALPGSLYIYQGDELGLPEVEDLPLGAIQDPMHFRSGGLDPGRDGCRVPLPWSDDEPPYGFSSSADVKPWLPQPTNWGDLTVQRQDEDPRSFLNLYRSLLRVRRNETDLHTSDLRWLSEVGEVLGFARGDRFVCLVNLGPEPIELPSGAEVLLTSDALEDGRLATDVAVWLRLPDGEIAAEK
jgi:alpha-glucosidase